MECSSSQWLLLARQVTAKLKTGRMLQRLAPWVVAAGVLLGLFAFAGRWYQWAWTGNGTVIGAATILFAAAGLIFHARLRQTEPEIRQSCARLDAVCQLHNGLTTAAAGRGQWPPMKAGAHDALRIDYRRVSTPFVLFVAFLLAGWLVPLPGTAARALTVTPPRSHGEIAATLAELQKSGAVEPKDLEQLKKQLDELRNHPPEDWYRHSNLEAADHLQEGLKQSIRGMMENFRQAGTALQSLETAGETGALTQHDQQRLAQEFKSAVDGLKNSSPALNEKLMSALSKIDPNSLKSLSGEEMQKMLDQLETLAGACRNCLGNGNRFGNGEAQQALEELLGDGPPGANGRRPGNRSGGEPDQDGPGQGGVNRGPGVAPLPLSAVPTDLGTQNPEAVSSTDLSRTLPGDTIGTTETEHRPDKSVTGPQTSGAAGATGRGGEAVWREALMPQEKAVLQKYFK